MASEVRLLGELLELLQLGLVALDVFGRQLQDVQEDLGQRRPFGAWEAQGAQRGAQGGHGAVVGHLAGLQEQHFASKSYVYLHVYYIMLSCYTCIMDLSYIA